MKAIKSNFIIALLLAIILIACRNQQRGRANEIHSFFTKEVIWPLWEAQEWDEPETIVINGEEAESENQLYVFSKWSNDSLYFYFKVEDTDLRAYQTENDHPELFLDDMVEILIDTGNHKDSCWSEDDIVYHVNLLGVKKDDRGSKECITNPEWNGNVRISLQLFGTLNDTTDIDTGYLITLAFPWDELRRKPERGLKMGINFANGDNDGKGRQIFDWVGAWPMRSPYAFGELILK